MRQIVFDVPGPPVAKSKKLRIFGGHASAYNEPKVDDYQGRVCILAREALGIMGMFEGLVRVQIIAVFERPKRLLERVKWTGLLRCGCAGRIPYDKKPDFDNIFKSLGDGMKWAGVYSDDCKIDNWDGSRRVYAAIGELPHVEVLVEELAREVEV